MSIAHCKNFHFTLYFTGFVSYMSNIQNMSFRGHHRKRLVVTKCHYSRAPFWYSPMAWKPVQRWFFILGLIRMAIPHELWLPQVCQVCRKYLWNFHPRDSSIYDARSVVSQDQNPEILVEMHGNNGPWRDPPAAIPALSEERKSKVKVLSEIAGYLLQDIERTVLFAWNFDDTEKEPTVLPAAFPNLLGQWG